MPGPALHHLIVDRLKASIQANTGLGGNLTAGDYAPLQALLADPANLPYLFLGCQGPDPFFFNTKDLNPTLGRFVALYNDVGDFLRKFEALLLEAVPQPVLDALEAFDEAANQVIQSSSLLTEIQQTFEDLNHVLTGLLDMLLEGVKKFISQFNLFDLISHPYRDGAAEGEWWWFDAMHYRKTGRFTQAMLDATRDRSSPLHLYALGYLSHVAADTVGHAYVNLYSGGPYRSQAQRHKTGENFQDVFNLLDLANLDWNHSKLHALYNFNFTGVISDDEPDANPTLPADLANLLADTLNRIYQEDADAAPDYGKTLTASDVDDTYRLWYRFMRSFTETGTLPPPVAYSFTAELREVWEQALDNLEDVGDFLEGAVDSASNFGLLAIFIVLAATVIAAVLAAIAVADAILGAVATVGTATIRYAACLIYEQVFNAFQNFRLGLALNGLSFPMREHLSEPRLRQFITPAFADPTGFNAAAVAPFEPLLKFSPRFLSDPLASLFNQERHLVYPLTDGEKRAVRPAPPSYFNQLPSHYAFGRIPLDAELLGELVGLAASANRRESDLTTLLGERTLGNAVDLSGALYARWFAGAPLPDFNLDSDRGYGYLCWTQRGDPPHEPEPLVTNTAAADPTQVQLDVLP